MASDLTGLAAVEAGLAALPESLREPAARALASLRPRLEGIDGGLAPDTVAALPRLLAVSPFVGRECAGRPGLIEELLASGDLDRDYSPGEAASRVQGALEPVTGEADLLSVLRCFRAREMVRIAWRDLAGRADLDQVLAELSWLADAVLDAALAWLHADQCRRFGTPRDEGGEEQALFVIAMGKLGGCELNFSSDLDLIFVYPEAGETAGGPRSMSNQEFFDRLGRRLIKALNDVTADGFVFRIDMRLRPFGESGALTLGMAAMEMYYEAHARDWERYAMVKGRIAAGNREAGERMLAALQPFVYRRYLDYGMLAALREMKQLITAEVSRSALDDDIKRGPGGIREIEFLAQVFQLIRGGQEPALRTASTRAALAALKDLNLLPAATVEELQSAYRFLRNSEHRLQQIDDRQTQDLPENDEDRARVALGMGYADWPAYLAALQAHRQRVQAHFADLLGAPPEEVAAGTGDAAEQKQAITMLWSGEAGEETRLGILKALGFTEPAAALQEIDKLRLSHDIGRLGQHGQERLGRLLPMILQTVAGGHNETSALARIFKLLEAVARRSVYMVLLVEHPQALRQLARLMAASPWVADYITLQPALLDELLDPRRLYSPPGREELKSELAAELGKHKADDLERQMDALRHFRYTQMLKVAAADLTGHLPLPEVSNHLTWIAETVLESALRLAWRHLSARHGEPRCGHQGGTGPAGFAIIAYGKLGGLELGYGSDLDLVFLHDSEGEDVPTDGASPIETSVFFTRLAQRVIHLLSTVTPAGQTYKIDTRLRPSGASGLLVSNLEGFLKYQLSDAWTWEHQALVRARYVTGSAEVGARFEAIRRQVLSRTRDAEGLRRDIVEMRERMRRELEVKAPEVFDLKQGKGGITDIEFMVQYGVLSHADVHPELLEWTDNLRLLETFGECGLLPASDCMALRDIYFAYRQETHRRALQEQPPLVGAGEFPTQRQKVNELWQRFVLQGA